MSDTRIKRERFLPYAYGRLGLRADLRRVEVDGHASSDGLDRDAHLVDLRGTWSRARLTFVVPPQDTLLTQVVPDAERSTPPVAVLLVLRCQATRLRRGVAASFEHTGTELEVTIELERDELAGHAELLPYLVRTANGSSEAGGFAHRVGNRIASARPWSIRVDLQRAPSGRSLDVQFKSFGKDESIALADRGSMWRLEAQAETPILWSNQDHGSIAELLRHEGTRGRRAYLREVVFDRIGSSVWTQLFFAATVSIRESDGSIYGWEQSVLDLLLPDMYPAVPTAEGRLKYLRQELDDLPQVLARLDAALQRRDNGIQHLTRLVEAL